MCSTCLEDMRQHIIRHYEETGNVMGSREYDRSRLRPSRGTVRLHTKLSFNEVVKSCNLKPSQEAIYSTCLEDMRQHIIRHYEETGNVMGSREYDSLGLRPSRATIRSYTKLSFNEVVNSCNLEPSHETRVFLKPEELLDLLRTIANTENRRPTTDDFGGNRDSKLPHFSVFYNAFGSFEKALTLAGIDSIDDYKRAKLLNEIQRFVNEYGRSPHEHEFSKCNNPGAYPDKRLYNTHFTSFQEAVELAGFTLSPLPDNFWTQEKLLDHVSEIISEHVQNHGKPPQTTEWDSFYSPCKRTLEVVIGASYNEILIQLGFDPCFPTPVNRTDEEYIDYLRKYFEETGVEPTADALRKNKQYPNPGLYVRRFGSFDIALEKAGFPSNKTYKPSELIDAVKAFHSTHKYYPAESELKYIDWFPSRKAFKNHFGSLYNLYRELGIPIPTHGPPGAYSKKQLAKDGHLCDSLSERLVDDFIYEHKVPHKVHVYYPEHPIYNKFGRKRCDFFIQLPDGSTLYIEYAGITNRKNYRENLEQKIALCKEEQLKLLVIYPSDLVRLKDIFLPYF